MADYPNPTNPDPFEDAEGIDVGHTLELSLDDAATIDNLQAFADQVASGSFPEGETAREVGAEPVDLVLDAPPLSSLEIEKRVRELEQMHIADQERYKRLLADFQNYRNRTSREVQMGVELAEKRILLEVLPVLDSFERCLDASYQGVDDFRSGVELIRKQFYDVLRRLSVAEVDIHPGDPFDAQVAEALTTLEIPGLPEGSVADVYEKGFLLRDQLLRAARVVVARHSQSSPGETLDGNQQA